MIIQTWIAVCDCCGQTENVKTVTGRYNERKPELPNGWGYGHNKDFALCPKCLKYMKGEHNDA